MDDISKLIANEFAPPSLIPSVGSDDVKCGMEGIGKIGLMVEIYEEKVMFISPERDLFDTSKNIYKLKSIKKIITSNDRGKYSLI